MKNAPLLFSVLIEALIDHGFRVVDADHDINKVKIHLPTHSDDSFYQLYVGEHSPVIYVEAGNGKYSSAVDDYFLHVIHDSVYEIEALTQKMVNNDPRDILSRQLQNMVDEMRHKHFIQDAARLHMTDILRKIK